MVFKVQEETWLGDQEIQGKILCERGCPEETFSWTNEFIFSIGKVVHSEVDVDFSVYSSFSESKYWLHKFLWSGRYSRWGAILCWTSQGFQYKSIYGQAKAARLWYENFLNGLLYFGFVMRKMDIWLLMSKIVICVIYVDYCLFWERSQSDIDDVMNYFNEDGCR